MRSLIALLLILSASLSQPAEGASPGFADLLTNASAMTPRVVAPTEARIDTAFAPERGAEDLVLRCIDAARGSIRMAAYSLTLPTIVRALVAARKRGIDVQAVVDQRTNLGSDSPVKSKAALNVLVNAGIPVRMISTYAAHHDKYLVVDGVTVQTGSFNYTDSAARRNSENVVVLWNYPNVAKDFLVHWQSRFDQGVPYVSAY